MMPTAMMATKTIPARMSMFMFWFRMSIGLSEEVGARVDDARKSIAGNLTHEQDAGAAFERAVVIRLHHHIECLPVLVHDFRLRRIARTRGAAEYRRHAPDEAVERHCERLILR